MNDLKTAKPAVKASETPAIALRANVSSGTEVRVARRTGALFKALSSDFLLREQFVTDPSQVLGEFVLGERPSVEAGDIANQLVYAVMSNPGLRDWLGTYARQQNGTTPARDEFAHVFAKAVARNGDDLTILALIRGASGENDHFALQADLLRFFVGLIGAGRAASGTEMSGGGPGTELQPGPGGTETSIPGSIFRSPGAVFNGTEVSGPGTEQTPGPGGTERSVPGPIFRNPGSVFSGTEVSGPGTEQTPGPGGTEHSVPGMQAGGWEIAPHLQVSFAALVQYASLLRSRGALDRSGMEGR